MRNEEAYLKRRTQSWRRLEIICDKGEASWKKLSGLELVEFVRLYRQTSADLAYLMTHSSNQDVVEHLNRLVGRAYSLLYRTPTKSFMTIVEEGLYLAASTMRKNRHYFWLSTALFFIMSLTVFGIMLARPDLRHHFVSPAAELNHESWLQGSHAPKNASMGASATTFYATNNPMAGINSVSVGAATAGIGSMYVLWMNAAGLGALAADMFQAGLLPFLLISISPHGVSEIGGFMISIGIGMKFAWAIISPGRRTRGEALTHASKEGFVLFILALIMIFMAAPIEGFFSFNPAVPLWVKGVVAAGAFTAWTVFFTRYGLDRDVEEMPTDSFVLAAD